MGPHPALAQKDYCTVPGVYFFGVFRKLNCHTPYIKSDSDSTVFVYIVR